MVINREAKRDIIPGSQAETAIHPLLAFIEETRMVANFWLRSGNAYTSNNFQGFLADTIEKLNGKKIGLFRGDSGFYGKEVFDYLEENERVGKLYHCCKAIQTYSTENSGAYPLDKSK